MFLALRRLLARQLSSQLLPKGDSERKWLMFSGISFFSASPLSIHHIEGFGFGLSFTILLPCPDHHAR